jgi:hypothetical protein
MTSAEAKQFWQTLARDEPEKALALAKAAPILVPAWRIWEDNATRKDWTCSYAFAHREPGLAYVAYVHGCPKSGPYPSLPAAQSACDAKLRELGYLLEPSE